MGGGVAEMHDVDEGDHGNILFFNTVDPSFLCC